MGVVRRVERGRGRKGNIRGRMESFQTAEGSVRTGRVDNDQYIIETRPISAEQMKTNW